MYFPIFSSSQFCEAFTSPPLSARLPPRVLGSAEHSADVRHSWGLCFEAETSATPTSTGATSTPTGAGQASAFSKLRMYNTSSSLKWQLDSTHQILGPTAKCVQVFTFLDLYVVVILQEAPCSGCNFPKFLT